MNRTRVCMVSLVCLFLCPARLLALDEDVTVKVTWDANSEQDLAGYRLYWGTSDRGTAADAAQFSYDTNKLATVSSTPGTTVDGLGSNILYYFALTAFNSNQVESLFSDQVVFQPTDIPVTNGAAWRYRKGTAEPAVPARAWREPDFDDSGWSSGNAPFGYGDGPYGTALADMRSNYPSLYMRRTFQVANPSLVTEAKLDMRYDDGFIVWLNGVEVARLNVTGSPGTFVPHSATASDVVGDGTAWSVTLTGKDVPAFRAGENVLAVHGFNRSLAGSSDFTLDAKLTLVRHALALDTDMDRDGLPDAWEISHFGTNTTQDAATDSDGDGVRDIEEFVAGTDPDGSNSYLAVTLAGAPTGELLVSLPGLQATGAGLAAYDRYYALEARDAWVDAIWGAVPGYAARLGTGSAIIYTNPGADSVGYYRGRVWLQPKP